MTFDPSVVKALGSIQIITKEFPSWELQYYGAEREGDCSSIIYLQHLLFHPSHSRQGQLWTGESSDSGAARLQTYLMWNTSCKLSHEMSTL